MCKDRSKADLCIFTGKKESNFNIICSPLSALCSLPHAPFSMLHATEISWQYIRKAMW